MENYAFGLNIYDCSLNLLALYIELYSESCLFRPSAVLQESYCYLSPLFKSFLHTSKLLMWICLTNNLCLILTIKFCSQKKQKKKKENLKTVKSTYRKYFLYKVVHKRNSNLGKRWKEFINSSGNYKTKHFMVKCIKEKWLYYFLSLGNMH